MLRKVGTFLIGVLLLASGAYAQSSSHIVLTNDQDFTVANGKFLSGVYECSEGGYIDVSCLAGALPSIGCPAGYAIQVITSLQTPTCVQVANFGPAGSDTYIQYNNMDLFGADQYLTWKYNTQTLSMGIPGNAGYAAFGGTTLASLGTPAVDGTIAYCTDCVTGTSPCSGSGTGSMAEYVAGAWACFATNSGASGISGTTNQVAKFTSSSSIGDSGITDDATTVSIPSEDLSYGQALYIAGLNAVNASGSAAATDRLALCTSGSSADVTYTLPAPTGSGRVLDVGKVDSGTKACVIATASGAINSGTIVTLSTQWQWDTCIDISSGQWSCRGAGVVS